MIDLILIGTLTLIASFLGTISGFGISTIMVPILALFFPLGPTLLFVAILNMFTNFWKVTLFRNGLDWRLIALFGIPAAFTAYIGAKAIPYFSNELLSSILGAFLVFYALFIIFVPDFKVKKTDGTAVTGGALSGFIAGLFGVGGGIRVAFLSSFKMKKEVYLATIGLIAVMTDITRITTYIMEGIRFENTLTWGLLLFIPLSFIGAFIAKKIIKKVPQKYFRDIIAVFLIAAGIALIIF